MAGDKWLPSDGLVKIVLARFKTSVGYAESIVRKALDSGDVYKTPRLAADDDSWFYRNLGIEPPLTVRYPGRYSEDDFLDWLRRNPPQAEPVTKQPEPAERPREQATRGQPQRDIIKVALKKLFPPDGEPPELPPHIVLQRVKRWLTDNGYEDVPVTRRTLNRALERGK